MRNALLVVDVQVDFVEGGSLGVQGGLSVAAMIARHVRHFRNEYQFIVASRDYHESAPDHISDHPDFVNTWPPHCMVGTPGAAFVPTIQNLVREKYIHAVVTKGRTAAAYSAFDGYDPRGHKLLGGPGRRLPGLSAGPYQRCDAIDAVGHLDLPDELTATRTIVAPPAPSRVAPARPLCP